MRRSWRTTRTAATPEPERARHATLPHALDARVQARVRTGTPFAVLTREALSAYLADTPLPSPPTPADNAGTLRALEEQLAALATRVEVLE